VSVRKRTACHFAVLETVAPLTHLGGAMPASRNPHPQRVAQLYGGTTQLWAGQSVPLNGSGNGLAAGAVY